MSITGNENDYGRWLSRKDFQRHSSKTDDELLAQIHHLGFKKALIEDMPKLRKYWASRTASASLTHVSNSNNSSIRI